MKKSLIAMVLAITAFATLVHVESRADGVRDCVIVNGVRHCSGGGVGPGLPPQRPPQYPPHRPPLPPQRPPGGYYPPHYPPPVYNPRPPVYLPPIYQPPVRPGWDFYRAQNISWNLSNATQNTLRIAEQEARWSNNSQQQWAVYKLQELAQAANDLRNELSRYPQSPSYTSYNYRNLKRDFEEARESLYWAYFSRSVELNFDQVERSMLDLDNLYWGY